MKSENLEKQKASHRKTEQQDINKKEFFFWFLEENELNHVCIFEIQKSKRKRPGRTDRKGAFESIAVDIQKKMDFARIF